MMDLNSNAVLEDWDKYEGNSDSDFSQTKILSITVNNVLYTAQTTTNPFQNHNVNNIMIESYLTDYKEHEIEVLDDVSSWEVDDTIVIASSDYDWRQAEEFKIKAVNGKKITISGEVFYEHKGEILNDIDQRAEVGLLTRNIKIHGKMNSGECEMPEVNVCDETAKADTFGGHTKALEGFKAYNIEGAELYHMGQATVLGSYPIHFHVAKDTKRNGERTKVQNNVIRDTFQRCITIHASFDLDILYNVAYNNTGHCFFLEDGAEKGNWFEGNLGIGTKKGEMLLSDKDPSTFWITSPLTTMINNRAAGSDNSKGVGIWFLFPDDEVGVAKEVGLSIFDKKEAKYTAITKFKDNVAHSNGNIGLALFRRLGENHEIIGCSTYSPRVDPKLGSKSELKAVVFDGFVGMYKNS